MVSTPFRRALHGPFAAVWRIRVWCRVSQAIGICTASTPSGASASVSRRNSSA